MASIVPTGFATKRFFTVVLFLFAAMLLARPVFASTLIIDTDSEFKQLRLAPYISQYNGSHAPENAQVASTLPDSDFSPIGAASPLRLLETCWFRLSIQNNTSQHRSLILDLDQALLDRIEWRSSDGKAVKELVTGQNYPIASRDIDYDFFAFHLDVPAGETLTVNFSIYTPHTALFVPTLTDNEKFISQITLSSRFSGSVMGMLYAICFFLFLYILRIKKIGIEHTMFVFSLTCFISVLYIAGIIQRYIPDNAIPLRNMMYIVIHGMQAITFCMLLRGFYQTSRYYTVFEKLLLFLIAAVLLIFAMLPMLNVEYLLLAILGVISLMMLISLSLSVLALLQGHAGTYLFSVGLLLFVAMAMVSALAAFGVLPASFMARYGYELGLTVLVDFIFLAVVSRIFSAERTNLLMESEMIRLDAEMKARSEFVDRVTHDIKSPLSAVLGAAQLLRDKKDLQDSDAYLGIIQRSCGVVISIVDDILSHSRMKANQLSLHSQSFSLQKLLLDIESSIKVSQQHKNVIFSMVVGQDIPALVDGDKMRVSQLLINLLTNAFKFTDEGRVTLTVDVVEKIKNKIHVRFVIQDTGIGMSESFLRKAFEPYAREENRAGYRPGFGLGLSICQHIVELMGGSIDVLSAIQQGSRFTVVLPLTVPE